MRQISDKIRRVFRYTIYTLLPLGGGWVGVSCSDFLDIPSRSEIVEEEFWNEKADIDNIVSGCYARMQADDVVTRMIVWGEARSENIKVGPNIDKDANLQNVVKENITAKNPYTSWDGFYTVINRCNTVVKNAPKVASHDPGYTEGEMRATVAEVSALRDLCYFYLIRTFHDVPYSTTAYTDDDQYMTLEPTPFEDILDSLINDLETQQNYAMTRYPDTKPLYQTGRITKCAIWAMLCEMYLWKGDYNSCIKYADMVIEDKVNLKRERSSGLFGGEGNINPRIGNYPLETDPLGSSSFGSYYRAIFSDAGSEETIFELIYDEAGAGRTMLGNSAVGRLYGSDGMSPFLAASDIVTGDYATTSNRAVYANENYYADARLYYNAFNALSTAPIFKYTYNTVLLTSVSSQTGKATMGVGTQYEYYKTGNDDHYTNSSPWIIYRVPDIMLMKAEALCQGLREGSDEEVIAYNAPILEEIFELVNTINKRALCQPTSNLTFTLNASKYNTRTRMDELVMQERQRELMYEGKRWYDLVRRSMRDGNTSVLCQAMSNRDGINSQYVQSFFGNTATGMNAIFWPYNDEECKVNPNLAKHQNPAFGSGEGNITK